MRPIESTDGDLLIRFHEGLSSETIRRRFFGGHPYLSANQTLRFTHVDHHDREALVAVVGDEIIAVARYDRLDDLADAEVAFVVADRWQGMGVAPLLLALLVARARQVGIARFVAETLEENRPMIDVFRHSGLSMTTSTSCGVLQVSMSL